MRNILLFIPVCLFALAGLPLFAATPDTLPEIVCPTKVILFASPASCTADFTYTVTVTDDQPGWTLVQEAGLPSGSAFPVGTTLNHFLATDTDGNTAACSFPVTVVDTVAPVALCAANITVTLGPDDPNDCYTGPVAWLTASAFDAGSYDDCGGVLLTIRRTSPLSDCINSLNSLNGQPDCHDVFPDFPSEFEKAISEQDSIKFYCCEGGIPAGFENFELRAYQLAPDGGFATGINGQPVFGSCSLELYVDTAICPQPAPFLNGLIDLDSDKDCTVDNTGFGFPAMVVRAITPAGDTLFASSDVSGYYSFGDVPGGDYTVEIFPPSPIWEICDNPAVVNANSWDWLQKWWAAQLETDCPLMYTDLAGGILRPCSTSTWVVKNCNIGGAEATDAYAQVVPDPLLTLVSVSEPYTLSGDTLTVPLGDIAPGACREFSIVLEVPCDPGLAGQHLCVESHIYPDTFCWPPEPLWSGAQIVASATCTGDSVHFTLRNTGTAPTAAPLDYIVIDDMVIMRDGQLPGGFAPGAVQHETLPADGDALRIIAQQETNHPAASMPSLVVENCNGVTFPSQIPAFPNEDGDPFSDLACRPVVTSYDPNEKLAFPVGYSDQHLIEPNVPLSYQLNFQNTGTDTAFLVVLRDTLSALLDPASIRMGASSHLYSWSLEGPGYLEIRFENILLPDSNVNEAASHGFVQFDMAQQKDNPVGSVIENRAGIYFDINPVVLTNTVFHTVGKNFVASSAGETPGATTLQVYPNPAGESIFVPLERDADIRLTDGLGRTLRQWSAQAPGIHIRRAGWSDGLYLLEARASDGTIRVAKIVWH